MIEGAERGIEHVAGAEIDAPFAKVAGRAVARDVDEIRRDVDRHHMGAAARGLHRQRAGAAARVLITSPSTVNTASSCADAKPADKATMAALVSKVLNSIFSPP